MGETQIVLQKKAAGRRLDLRPAGFVVVLPGLVVATCPQLLQHQLLRPPERHRLLERHHLRD